MSICNQNKISDNVLDKTTVLTKAEKKPEKTSYLLRLCYFILLLLSYA